MNLTQPTGSLINNIYANSKQQQQPKNGDGATALCHTDRYSCTIVEVVDTKTIIVQEDNAKRIDDNGMSESQRYEYSANPESPLIIVTLRKNGRWVRYGEPSSNGLIFAIGIRDSYHDYSF